MRAQSAPLSKDVSLMIGNYQNYLRMASADRIQLQSVLIMGFPLTLWSMTLPWIGPKNEENPNSIFFAMIAYSRAVQS